MDEAICVSSLVRGDRDKSLLRLPVHEGPQAQSRSVFYRGDFHDCLHPVHRVPRRLSAGGVRLHAARRSAGKYLLHYGE